MRAGRSREGASRSCSTCSSNAVKFTPPGGQVGSTRRGSGRRDRVVSIDVRDTGIGIPAEQLAHVFEPFVQVEPASRGAREGTGLGLSISRDLARGMGGDLRARGGAGEG